MISIFNGRERTLGGATSEIFAQVSVEFREHLHILKGAHLSIFLAISLHANARGWSWPSRKLLARETGYNTDTVTRALSKLCRISINDQRLLLRYQRSKGNGTFDHNHYLIFPSPEEIAQYEHSQPNLIQYELQPYSGLPLTVEPLTVEPLTVNHCTKNNHAEREPNEEEPSKEETAASKPLAASSQAPICPIHNMVMTRREKSGDTWYSHLTAEGTWCRGGIQSQADSDTRRASAAARQKYLQYVGKDSDLIQ